MKRRKGGTFWHWTQYTVKLYTTKRRRNVECCCTFYQMKANRKKTGGKLIANKLNFFLAAKMCKPTQGKCYSD